MYLIKREQTIEITPTVAELAAAFCEMDGAEQAQFLNVIGQLAESWTAPFPFQVQNIIDSGKLNNFGRYVMRTFGEYAD